MAKLEEFLDKMSDMGPSLPAIFGATSDALKMIREKEVANKGIEILSGDKVADEAILRTLGVEKAIKDKWNVDLCQVLDLMKFFGSVFSMSSVFYKG
jgi:hypothetical protein